MVSSKVKAFSPASVGKRTGYFLRSTCTSSGISPRVVSSRSSGTRASPWIPSPARTMSFRAEAERASTPVSWQHTQMVPSCLVSGSSQLAVKGSQVWTPRGVEPSSGA